MAGEGVVVNKPFSAARLQALLAAYNGGIRVRHYYASAITVNSATTDVATFSTLPAKYRVLRLMAYNGSISLTTATVSLRTTTGGGGTAIVSAQALSALTAATRFADLTLAVTADTQTASSLTLRNDTAQGGAATCSFVLEVLEVP